MDSGATSGTASCKSKRLDKARRIWTTPEEEALIVALKDVITKGWKSENGFRAGYLPLLEAAMKNVFPETDLRGNPHINSKIHVWKKQYGTLASILAKSGIGWNDNDNMVDATNEAWDALVKVDNNARVMRYKRWPYYRDWCEIFGNDRATGDQVETFAAAVQDILNMNYQIPHDGDIGMEDFYRPSEDAAESMSVTHTPSCRPPSGTAKVSAKKRKRECDKIAEAINNLAEITKETMANFVKEMASDSKAENALRLENAMDNVLCSLRGIPELTSSEKMRVADLLVENPNKLGFFLRLNNEEKLNFSKGLLQP